MAHGDDHCSGFECVEMRKGRPWKYEIDIFGLAATAYMLLHGEYMELTYERRARDRRHDQRHGRQHDASPRGGVCGGDDSLCKGCDGIPNSGQTTGA